MIQKIAHIGIAVNKLEEQIPLYRDMLQLSFIGTEEVPEQKVRVAMFDVGGVHIELLEPTSPESPIAKFIEKKGQGIHHIAYEVDNAKETIAMLRSKNVQMIDNEPRSGANGMQIAFIHPKSTLGVLTELCQHASCGCSCDGKH